jgi:hypothetical protein
MSVQPLVRFALELVGCDIPHQAGVSRILGVNDTALGTNGRHPD